MKCPFCGKEMQQGKLRTRRDNYFVPNCCKVLILYAKNMENAGATLVSPDCTGAIYEENWQTTFLCIGCRKIIADF